MSFFAGMVAGYLAACISLFVLLAVGAACCSWRPRSENPKPPIPSPQSKIRPTQHVDAAGRGYITLGEGPTPVPAESLVSIDRTPLHGVQQVAPDTGSGKPVVFLPGPAPDRDRHMCQLLAELNAAYATLHKAADQNTFLRRRVAELETSRQQFFAGILQRN